MSSNPSYIEVAVAAPLYHTLTYGVKPDDRERLLPGVRVLVPLGPRRVTGFILGRDSIVSDEARDKIRHIIEILDRDPLFPEEMIPFFRWIAQYYAYPIGEVVKGALPGGMTARSGTRVSLTDKGREFLMSTAAPTPEDFPLADELLQKGHLTPAMVHRLRRNAKNRRLLEKWRDAGFLVIRDELIGGGTGEKKEVCIVLADTKEASCCLTLKPSEKRTLELVTSMTAGKDGVVPRAEITKQYTGAGKAIRSLVEKSVLELVERPVYRDPFGERPPFFPAPESLTEEQNQALALLLPAIRERKFATFLLHGVTGSGKTEVYLRAAAETLSLGRSVLVLVPEIALAAQLEGHFISRFGDQVAILHSGLTSGERYDQWMRIARGEVKIVIGARSAIFAPLSDIGLIVVDEEHDQAYKQDDSLHYHARDLAVLRGSLQKALVLLGSATPSIISYHHAMQGKYRLISLAKRIEDRPLPSVTVVDLKDSKSEQARPPLFSEELAAALRENLDQGQQSLVFLNRRGFANLMLCLECGRTIQCRHCQVTLTLHKGRKELICHYCGYASQSDIICPHCRSLRLLGIGFGTERIEEELRTLLPRARVARLDRDTATDRDEYIKILKKVHTGEVDILVGTQMITKGHHFPNVTLVGVIWADGGLGIPDFKAGERTFQLLSQVTGRAGRGEKPGRVIIQTFQPGHYSIARARAHDYEGLYKEEIMRRSPLSFPPFSRQINLRIAGDREEEVKDAALQLSTTTRELPGFGGDVRVLGPAPAPLSRLRGKYRWQLLLQGTTSEKVREFCKILMEKNQALRSKTGLAITVDVDPENML